MAKNLSPFAAGCKPVLNHAVPADALNCAAASTTNADAVVSFTADTQRGFIVSQLVWSYSGAPTGGRLLLQDATGALLDLDVSGAGPGQLALNPPIISGTSSNLTATLKAGGAGVTGKLNLVCWKLD